MPRPRNDRNQIEQRRRQIVEGARRCFAARGFHGAGVEDLEQVCGFTRGTLFRYFPGKAAMLTAVIESEAGRREAVLEEALAGAGSAVGTRTLAAVTVALLAAQLRLSREDPWSLRLRLELRSLAQADPSLAPAVTQLERRRRQWRRQMVAKLRAERLIHPGWEVELATDLVSATFLGLAVDRAYDFPRGAAETALLAAAAHMLAATLSAAPPVQRPGQQSG